MKIEAICPITNKKVDENVARFNATITVLLLAAFVVSDTPLIALFLLVDFLLRGFELSAYSPIAIVSKKIVAALALKPKIINAGPKLFAAKVGALFSLSVMVSAFLGQTPLAFAFSAIFGICAFLEAAFGFCLACRIYPYLYKLTHFVFAKTIRE
jgi:hypothetical protein